MLDIRLRTATAVLCTAIVASWLAACGRLADRTAVVAEERVTARVDRLWGAADTGALTFGTVLSMAVAPDGRLLVLDGKAADVLEFSHDGDVVRRFGRRGAGPGELQTPVQLGLHGDSLWVADVRLQRITLFDRHGSAVRTISVTGRDRESVWFQPDALLSDGSMLVAEQLAPASRDSAPQLLLMKPNGTVQHIGFVTPFESWTFLADDGTQRRYFQPLQSRAVHSFSRDGAWLAFADARPADGSGTAQLLVRRLAIRDSGTWNRSLPYAPVPVTDQLLDSLVDARLTKRSATERQRARLALVNTPATMPPIRGLMVDTHGGIWIGRGDLPGNQWMHIRETAPAPRVAQFPLGFLPFDARGDSVWGRYEHDRYGATVALLLLDGSAL